MEADSDTLPETGARPRGRPRRLTLEQVLDAAIAMGPHELTIAGIARRLGVAKAVLYTYVGSRAELVKLAKARAGQQRRLPVERGQPWAIVALEYGRSLFDVMTMEGQLLEAWIDGEQPPMVELDAAENWLEAMTSRGLDLDQAHQLLRVVTYLVVGAAANYKHEAALKRDNSRRSVAARKAVLARRAGEVPLLRKSLDAFAFEMTSDTWEQALFLLLSGVAHEPALFASSGQPNFSSLPPWPQTGS